MFVITNATLGTHESRIAGDCFLESTARVGCGSFVALSVYITSSLCRASKLRWPFAVDKRWESLWPVVSRYAFALIAFPRQALESALKWDWEERKFPHRFDSVSSENLITSKLTHKNKMFLKIAMKERSFAKANKACCDKKFIYCFVITSH